MGDPTIQRIGDTLCLGLSGIYLCYSFLAVLVLSAPIWGKGGYKVRLEALTKMHMNVCVVSVVLLFLSLVLVTWRTWAFDSSVRTILSMPTTTPDEEYFRTLEHTVQRCTPPSILLITIANLNSAQPTHSGLEPRQPVVATPNINTFARADGGQLYAVRLGADTMGELSFGCDALREIYDAGRRGRKAQSLGEAAEWDSLFVISVTMTLASQRLSRLGEIRYDASVKDEFGNKAAYVVAVDPRLYSGSATSREQAEDYARERRKILTDTATGRGFVSVPDYRR
jgi:hypothetical protein